MSGKQGPYYAADRSDSDILAERIIDSTFLVINAIILLALVLQARKTLLSKVNRTFHNWLTISFIVATLLRNEIP